MGNANWKELKELNCCSTCQNKDNNDLERMSVSSSKKGQPFYNKNNENETFDLSVSRSRAPGTWEDDTYDFINNIKNMNLDNLHAEDDNVLFVDIQNELEKDGKPNLENFQKIIKEKIEDGFGVLTFNKGNEFLWFYKGYFENGKASGVGLQKSRKGNVYFGEWDNNKVQGYGIFHTAKDYVYKGEWKKDKQDGFGIVKVGDPEDRNQNDSYLFMGELNRGKKEGIGLLKTNKGDFEGEFMYDLIDGIGSITYHDGITYSGEWKQNQYHGLGKLVYSENPIRYYEGQFIESKREGFGIYRYGNKVYIAEWVKNKMDTGVLIEETLQGRKFWKMNKNQISGALNNREQIVYDDLAESIF